MEDDALIAQFDSGFRVGRDCSSQCVTKAGFEVKQLVEAGTELRMNGCPADRCSLAESVQSPGEPDVQVQAHGPVP